MADLPCVFPQLQSLKLSLKYIAPNGALTAAHASAVAAAISAATHISSLQLHRCANAYAFVPGAADVCMPLHPCIGRLTQLTSLSVTGFKVDTSDLLKLTVLSKLACLAILRCPAVGDQMDAAAAALACKQTGLRVLKLQGCGLDKPALLPALACCTGLRQLDLRANDKLPLCAETLMLLTALRQLTGLLLPAAALFDDSESRDVDGTKLNELQQVKAAMPQLSRLEFFARGKIVKI
jgi:hypothetical protein